MNILITGCNGLIGSKLIDLLRSDAVNLTGLARHKNQYINTVLLDLSSYWDVKALPDKVDVVIHLAQSEHFRNFPDKALDIFNVNIASTARLADYAVRAGAKKFIYASSGGIYGNMDKVFDEEDALPVSDLGYYLSSKLCSEIMLDNYKNHMDVQLLRFFFAYGPGQNKSMLIPRLIERIKNDQPIQLSSEEGIRINPIYVTDAATAVKKALMINGSHHINIAGNEVFSLRGICDRIGRKLQRKPVYEIMPAKATNLVADITKMKQLLVDPQVTFELALEDLIKE